MDKLRTIIFHIDVDSFFVSSELILRPELKDLEIAISNNKHNSVVSALSYKAKQKGAKVPMKLHEVKKYCPNIVNIQPNYKLYEIVSNRIYEFLRKKYSHLIEIGSIDEWFVDVTKLVQFSSIDELAYKIQREIKRDIGVDVSIGISYNKFLAKMATDLNKPKGISKIFENDIPTKLWPLPIESFIGIGKSSYQILKENGIITIGDLAKVNPNNSILKKHFKNTLEILISKANGFDVSNINTSRKTQSISSQYTFDKPFNNSISSIFNVIKRQSTTLSQELAKKNLSAYGVFVNIKYNDKTNATCSNQFYEPIFSEEDIYNKSITLFSSLWNENGIVTISIGLSLLKSNYLIFENRSLFDEQNDDAKNYRSIIKEIINKSNQKINSNNLKLLKDLK